jgi:hypothetical protein
MGGTYHPRTVGISYGTEHLCTGTLTQQEYRVSTMDAQPTKDDTQCATTQGSLVLEQHSDARVLDTFPSNPIVLDIPPRVD